MHPIEGFFQNAAEGYEYRIVTGREKKPYFQLLNIDMPKKRTSEQQRRGQIKSLTLNVLITRMLNYTQKEV